MNKTEKIRDKQGRFLEGHTQLNYNMRKGQHLSPKTEFQKGHPDLVPKEARKRAAKKISEARKKRKRELGFINSPKTRKKQRSNYKKGRDLEYRVMRILEKQGYCVSRFTASKGAWDVYAINDKELKVIQVKYNRPPTVKERKRMLFYPHPPSLTKEIWIYRGRRKGFVIEELKRR